MPTSILTGTKKLLGLDESYDAFDAELIMHINSVLSTMNELGVGTKAGFAITDASSTWEDFLGDDPRLNSAMSYMFLSVKLLFDPPQVGYVLTAYEKLRDEAAWRLTVQVESLFTIFTGEVKQIFGNQGDVHIIEITNPEGETLINSSGEYEAEFLPATRRYPTSVPLDTSEAASGILKLSVEVETGTYKVRLVSPRRTLLTVEVVAE